MAEEAPFFVNQTIGPRGEVRAFITTNTPIGVFESLVRLNLRMSKEADEIQGSGLLVDAGSFLPVVADIVLEIGREGQLIALIGVRREAQSVWKANLLVATAYAKATGLIIGKDGIMDFGTF